MSEENEMGEDLQIVDKNIIYIIGAVAIVGGIIAIASLVKGDELLQRIDKLDKSIRSLYDSITELEKNNTPKSSNDVVGSAIDDLIKNQTESAKMGLTQVQIDFLKDFMEAVSLDATKNVTFKNITTFQKPIKVQDQAIFDTKIIVKSSIDTSTVNAQRVQSDVYGVRSQGNAITGDSGAVQIYDKGKGGLRTVYNGIQATW